MKDTFDAVIDVLDGNSEVLETPDGGKITAEMVREIGAIAVCDARCELLQCDEDEFLEYISELIAERREEFVCEDCRAAAESEEKPS